MVSDEKRAELKARIEAGDETREGESLTDMARSAARDANEFVQKNPLMTLAGVAVIGLAIGALTTSSGRRMSRQAGQLAGKAGRRGMDYGRSLSQKANELAQETDERLEDLSDDVTRNARATKRDVKRRAGDFNDMLFFAGKKALRHAGRSMRSTKQKVSS